MLRRELAPAFSFKNKVKTMINKKLLAAASAAAVIASSASFAKTEGLYHHVDIVGTNYKTNGATGVDRDFNFGLGTGLKYAVSLGNNIYVAPGVNFAFNNAETQSTTEELEYSYGAGVDLGYDIDDKLSAFVNLGYQENRLEVSKTLESVVYGVGATYGINDNVDLGLSYQYVDYNKNGIASELNPDVVKLSVAYKL